MENLLASFDGDVVPVNPNGETVLGEPCVADVDSVGDPVDPAVVAVPPSVAVDVVRGIGEAGVPVLVVDTDTATAVERTGELLADAADVEGLLGLTGAGD